MVTAKNLIRDSKTDLGWDSNDPDYSTWRNNVKDYCIRMNLVSKTKAGDVAWKRSLSEIQSLGGFKPAVRTRIRDGSDFHLKAVEALLIDTLKKRSETTKKLAIKRAMKGGAPRDDATDGQADAGGEETDAHPGNAVAIWIADPCDGTHKIGGQWIWDNRGRRKLAVIEDRTVEGIWQAAKDYIPDGRSIREILGALEDPPAGNSVAADWTKMQTDAEVYTFLRITKANPIRLLLVLHRNDGTPDTPIAGVPNPYFAPIVLSLPKCMTTPQKILMRLSGITLASHHVGCRQRTTLTRSENTRFARESNDSRTCFVWWSDHIAPSSQMRSSMSQIIKTGALSTT